MTDSHTAPEWEHAALLTVDVQNDFTLSGAPAEIPGTLEKVPEMARLAAGFRHAGRPIIHIVRLYRADGEDADACRRQLLAGGVSLVRPGTPGADVVADLLPPDGAPMDPDLLLRGEPQHIAKHEWLVYKPRWGAFYRTGLEPLLHGLRVTTLVICGCNFPNCPRATIYEASERDYRLAVPPAALSGIYDRGVAELAAIGVALPAVDEIIAAVAPEVTKDS
ncbi:MAG: cysteine hydrolase [Deltaproteobacteria bacterium]|nr:cysteine hydrolase [Candidatus Anaeroferrophillacea bacterium]